jgi:sec-independent protein translocase protein TatB
MDIGIQEILLISVIALIVLGPERLPSAVRSLAIWIGKIKRSFNDIKSDIEKEFNADEIRQQIHNENILHQLGEPIEQLQQTAKELDSTLNDIDDSANKLANDIQQPLKTQQD